MMQNFGINLLAATQTVIRKQSYQLIKWIGRERNSNGVYVSLYDAAVTRHAGVQPISTEKKQVMGLELTVTYITIFDVELIDILSRTENPDKIIFNGYYYSPEPSSMDWNTQGGWNQVVCARGDKVELD